MSFSVVRCPLSVPRRAIKRQKGFTLLEILVAIAIFSLLTLSARQLFVSVIDAKEITRSNLQRLKEVEYTMLVLEQDFRQVVDRGVRTDGYVSTQSLFSDDTMLNTDDQAIAFVRSNWRNPAQQLPRSELQRVSYRLKSNTLERMHHPVLDPLENAEPANRELLNGVNSLKFRFFYNSKWHNALQDSGQLPEGLLIEMDLQDLGRIERRFLLPEQWESA
ncbi:type II secretion system minor pseudopilin GspJ [Endozoicomonas gorgoniicola]|uniref:Type II secretion system protein J n=1 Tax=Endozoicomonas gorgoniicola TaxID=1234144 RepID=A0ABT3N2W8_9GAMM|nr:type II secretion system minor pseudopilin GspJ [Endozoicomonas gorgoniicola]MCW7555975.1 type II secretion system minor pseudopilin GspJ [Endozoicomonas gorgoniicola]